LVFYLFSIHVQDTWFKGYFWVPLYL